MFETADGVTTHGCRHQNIAPWPPSPCYSSYSYDLLTTHSRPTGYPPTGPSRRWSNLWWPEGIVTYVDEQCQLDSSGNVVGVSFMDNFVLYLGILIVLFLAHLLILSAVEATWIATVSPASSLAHPSRRRRVAWLSVCLSVCSPARLLACSPSCPLESRRCGVTGLVGESVEDPDSSLLLWAPVGP